VRRRSGVAALRRYGQPVVSVLPWGRRRAPAVRGPSRSWLVPAAVAAVAFVVLVAHNSWLLTEPVHADADYAANEILIDDAKELSLLVGHYSRLGFNHPGPAYLYLQAAGEVLLFDVVELVPARYNAQLLTVLALNAAVLGAAAWLLLVGARNVTGALTVVALAAFVLVCETGGVGQPDRLLVSSWMPAVLAPTFLLFMVSGASLLAGRFRGCWLFALSGGLLLHGHVSMLGVAGPVVLVVVAWCVVRHRRGAHQAGRRDLVAAGLIAGLLALPLAIQLLLHWPGEWDDYWRAARENASRIGARDALAYVGSWWAPRGTLPPLLTIVVLVLAAVTGTVTRPPGTVRRTAAGLLAMAALVTPLFTYYAIDGIDDVGARYLGYFYLAVPITVVAVVVLTGSDALQRCESRLLRAVPVLACTVALTFAATTPRLGNGYRGEGGVPAAVLDLRQDARRDGRPVAVLIDVRSWGPAIGVLSHAVDNGLPMCIEDPSWRFAVTDEEICATRPAQGHWRIRATYIEEGAEPPDGTLTRSDHLALIEEP